MPVLTRRHSPEPFETVQWTGSNLDEIAEFTGLTPSVISGVMALDLAAQGGSVVLLELNWWVSRAHDGHLTVCSDGVARRWLAA
jgi:hypothetical protein